MLHPFEPPDDNARVVPLAPGLATLKRDFVPPVPVGTYVVLVARVTGYDQDCDGSAMARLEFVDRHGETTGWQANAVGLYPETELLVDHPGDLWEIAEHRP